MNSLGGLGGMLLVAPMRGREEKFHSASTSAGPCTVAPYAGA